ncbi:hypothetical protein [Actinocrispum wychmicini]|uniref:Uncharacterized protein n=1 Tax=Actinocrispum wychmicini TaxID=1213861 RepID=A0A4R2JT88_9PSEU|nr:hypothetical protein [Actinocrispum wychmicini]TCO60466.1 hypothetical protein EV192_10341 [Actinocrispum wychmicini]
MRENPLKKNTEDADSVPQELSFMRPIEPRDPADEEPKPSRAERRAAKSQVRNRSGKAQNNVRNQSVPNHRNFANRRSG